MCGHNHIYVVGWNASTTSRARSASSSDPSATIGAFVPRRDPISNVIHARAQTFDAPRSARRESLAAAVCRLDSPHAKASSVTLRVPAHANGSAIPASTKAFTSPDITTWKSSKPTDDTTSSPGRPLPSGTSPGSTDVTDTPSGSR